MSLLTPFHIAVRRNPGKPTQTDQFWTTLNSAQLRQIVCQDNLELSRRDGSNRMSLICWPMAASWTRPVTLV